MLPVICTSDMGAQRSEGAGCRGWRGWSARLVFCLFFGFTAAHSGVAAADEACRIAFDMGSSGIRAGASNHAATARAEAIPAELDGLFARWAELEAGGEN